MWQRVNRTDASVLSIPGLRTRDSEFILCFANFTADELQYMGTLMYRNSFRAS
jgi:hypothetical protein